MFNLYLYCQNLEKVICIYRPRGSVIFVSILTAKSIMCTNIWICYGLEVVFVYLHISYIIIPLCNSDWKHLAHNMRVWNILSIGCLRWSPYFLFHIWGFLFLAHPFRFLMIVRIFAFYLILSSNWYKYFNWTNAVIVKSTWETHVNALVLWNYCCYWSRI